MRFGRGRFSVSFWMTSVCLLIFVGTIVANFAWLRSWYIYDDKGQVCFQRSPLGSSAIKASISGVGCFSSSCTEVLERKGDVKIDAANLALKFSSRFVVRPIHERRLCTADCGGAGIVWLDIETLPAGVYSVWLGKQQVGTLSVPIDQNKLTCVGKANY
jgi:hypothetical protein